jgi:hypothetical protein
MANAPDSMAWLAMMAAKMATMNVGQNIGAVNYQMKKIRFGLHACKEKSFTVSR